MANLRQALEDALLEDPDDLGTSAAYADHLIEFGDPARRTHPDATRPRGRQNSAGPSEQAAHPRDRVAPEA